jgi:hypothetical protein
LRDRAASALNNTVLKCEQNRWRSWHSWTSRPMGRRLTVGGRGNALGRHQLSHPAATALLARAVLVRGGNGSLLLTRSGRSTMAWSCSSKPDRGPCATPGSASGTPVGVALTRRPVARSAKPGRESSPATRARLFSATRQGAEASVPSGQDSHVTQNQESQTGNGYVES